MGDMSAEPSMEEILSSIKRIIAEEGETPARTRRPARAASVALRDADGEEEVLELSDPMPSAPQARAPEPEPAPTPAAQPSPQAERAPAAAPAPERPAASAAPDSEKREPIVSPETAQASRGALEALSRLLVKPEPTSDGTLESLVREMLRPMLREWLDANLPPLVEQMVAREIGKITGQLS